MEKETKKYLIIGTTIVVVVGVGVVLWKKHQTQSAGTGAAPTDQSNQDELSLLAATLESNAYASATGGAASYSPHAVGASVPQSLTDEVLALEKALGIAPAETPSSPVTPATSGSGSSPSSTPAPTQAPAQQTPKPLHDLTSEMIRYNHGSPIFAMDGVAGEGVLVS